MATRPGQTTITHRDLNNNNQVNTRAVTPTKQRTPSAPISQTTTRGKCDGTLYRLTPLGKSNSPIHQMSPFHIHGRNPWSATTNPAWELAQTKDPHGINNFHQDSNGKMVITGQGRPRCNYCKLPYHGRQRYPFQLRDLEYNIDRQFHPPKGCLRKTDTKNYVPNRSRGHRSPMSVRLANETDNSGHPRFW